MTICELCKKSVDSGTTLRFGDYLYVFCSLCGRNIQRMIVDPHVEKMIEEVDFKIKENKL